MLDPSQAFMICTIAIVPPWLLIVLAPKWTWTHRLVHTSPVFLLFAMAYFGVRMTRPELPPGASLTSLEGFMIAVTSPYAALATWIHILVLDLFLGAWMARDAARQQFSQLWVVPCLVVTFVAAPIGLVAYLTTRGALRRTPTIDEAIRSSATSSAV